MDVSQTWKSLFQNWPDGIPHSGLLVTTFQEQVPFVEFMISGGVLLIERDKPDSYGTRALMISFDAISALKFTRPVELKEFAPMGFEPPM